MGQLRHDFRLALRNLARAPGFSALAVAILAVGIGASLTVFTWTQSLVLRPFPSVPASGELRVVSGRSEGGEPMALSAPDLRDLARELAPRVALAGVEMQSLSLFHAGRPERIWGGIVSGNYFDVLGVRAAHGRFFLPEEDRVAGAHPVAVLSDAFWRRRFAADPQVIGTTLQLNNSAFTVIGVAPEKFLGSENGLSLDLWVPIAMQEVVYPGTGRLERRDDHWLRTIARLAPEIDDRGAQAALDALAVRLAELHPGTHRGKSWRIETLARSPWGATQYMAPVMTILSAMVVLVLLTTAANVANLLLVRGLGRRREMAVRLALGAGRGDLVRQLAVESLLLSLAATAFGLGFSRWAIGGLTALMPPLPVPIAPNLELGPLGLLVAAALALASTLLAGLAPALEATSGRLEAALRDEAAGVGGRGRQRLRQALVVAQVALCCVLLVGGTLCLRAVGAGRGVELGFRPEGLLLAGIDLFPNGYNAERGRELQRRLLERISRIPGVESASLGRRLPLDLGGSSSVFLEIDGYAPAPDEEILVRLNQVGPGYLRTLGAELLRGRDFSPDDRRGSLPVAIVNETMARRYWPNGEALGRTIAWGDEAITVVGVARDLKFRDLGERPQPFFFVPLAQVYRGDCYLHLRTAGDPLALVPALRAAVAEIDPTLPLSAVKSMDEHLKIALFKQRIAAWMLSLFGLVALALSAVGLYGLAAYAFAQRVRELGLRLAIGASPSDLLRLMLGQGLKLVGLGLAIGLPLAIAVGQLLRAILLDVSPFDPLAFGAGLLLLAAVALLASFIPAHRAAALDPARALRGL